METEIITLSGRSSGNTKNTGINSRQNNDLVIAIYLHLYTNQMFISTLVQTFETMKTFCSL